MNNFFTRINFKKFNFSLPFAIFILSIILLNTYVVIKIYTQKQIANSTVRLHVVANSNSTEDQVIKLKISEKIQNYLNDNLSNLNSKSQIMQCLKSNVQSILNISNEELKSNGNDYIAYAKIGNISYDEKNSINMDMPKGNYDSIQIVLGKGEGKNFWSLVFPKQENIQNLSNIEALIPGISEIYGNENDLENNNDENSNNTNTYSLKILEVLEDLKTSISNKI